MKNPEESGGKNGMIYKIAIVEDDPKCADDIKKVVEKSCEALQIEGKIKIFPNGMEFVSDYQPVYDLILLDIEMPYLNGLDSAKKIRRVDRKVNIIFITYMAKYAINGYEVAAKDFIVKPVVYEEFLKKFKKIVEDEGKINNKQIMVNSDGVTHRISVYDICYLEVYGHYLHYHMKNGVLVAHGTIDSREKELKEYGFFRIYNSYLINMDYVQEIKQSTVVVNGDELKVSRFRKKEFLAALTVFLGEKA